MRARDWLGELVEAIRQAAAAGSPMCLGVRVRVTIRALGPHLFRVEREGGR